MRTLNQYDESVVGPGFDSIADAYGEVDFLKRTAEALVNQVSERQGGDALDVATGPGTAALLLAQRSPSLSVLGIDASAEMIARASSHAQSLRMQAVRFVTGSATALPFEPERFDVVICSSAIYYMPDLPQAVAEWARVLRSGGSLAFSTYGEGMLEPMSSLFDARVRLHGVDIPQPTPLYRLTKPQQCSALLTAAGLLRVRVHECQLGFWLPDADAWWSMLMSTGFRIPVAALAPGARAAFEHEHKREVAEQLSARGLWVNVPAILALADKA